MRVLVCGGRDYADMTTFIRTMRRLEIELGPFKTIIHGGAFGADALAHMFVYAEHGRYDEAVFQADWRTQGKAAGPLRNQKMIDEGRPDLVVAFPGGRGTADMVRRALTAGIKVLEVA